MKIKQGAKFAAVSLAVMMTMSSTVQAASFKDIPSGHWAYKSIDKVTDLGIMVGDNAGNFNPNDFIDKFDTSIMLAKIMGYKYSNVTAEEQAYYKQCYEKHKAYINQFVAKYTKWNSTANMEIAFLLEKGIYVNDDLLQFFTFRDNQDKLRALSREEISVFFVRVLGKVNDALNAGIANSSVFSDDASISSACKPYVYYLRSLGVINGDTSNKFSPNSAVTKAAMASMIEKVIALFPETPGYTTEPVSSSYKSVQGKISKIYSSFRALFISSNESAFNNQTLTVSPDATIKVNGYVKNFSDLQPDMDFTGVVQNGEFVSLTAQSGLVTNNTTTPPATTAAPSDPISYTTLEGTVSSYKSDTTGNYIEIELRLINPKGNIYTEKRTYVLSSDCDITRGDLDVSFGSIASGDIATMKVSGSTAYSLKVEEKNRSISGTLIEKKYVDEIGAQYLVIKDKADKLYELRVTPASLLHRGSSSLKVAVANLRVGDSVEVNTEYDAIVNLVAYGSSQTVDVWINEIMISSKGSKVTTTNADGEVMTYPIIANTVDVYSLRIGSKVRLRLDSWEIETLSVLQEAKTDYITGYLSNVKSSSVTISDVVGAYYGSKEFTYNDSTVIMDSLTGKLVSNTYLNAGMKVYIVFDSNISSYAKTITILSY